MPYRLPPAVKAEIDECVAQWEAQLDAERAPLQDVLA